MPVQAAMTHAPHSSHTSPVSRRPKQSVTTSYVVVAIQNANSVPTAEKKTARTSRTERFAAAHFAPTFARQLRHPDPGIRRESARMLMELAPFVGDALDGIVRDTQADPEMRVYGVVVLAKRGDP
jgi:hypothetical protein